jgi:hypothetical protein
VFENRTLRRKFDPNRDKVTGEWRKLHGEELNDLYCSPTIVQVMKSRIVIWAGHVACMKKGRGVYRVLVGKPEGKRPLDRPRHVLEQACQIEGPPRAIWVTLCRMLQVPC